ncbi:MAG: hypothetical protein EA379_06340, partial [Phycisphaerales bacterium]
MPNDTDISSLLNERRLFPPDAAFSEGAHVGSMADYRARYARSIEDPEAFWAEAAESLSWFTP